MKKKIVFINPFFKGEFLNYFPLFLKSCKNNPEFEWLIFTDNKGKYEYPSNVHKIDMSFEQLHELINKKFGFVVALGQPYKLCDYKCMYGFIFEEYIKDYDYWGHTDYDMICGDLSHFITDKLLDQYEKLFVLGHFTLYRNNYENNRMFTKKIMGKEFYKEVLHSDRNMNFDEDWNGRTNINDIFRQERRNLYGNDGNESMIADIYTKSSDFKVTYQNYGESVSIVEKKSNSFFAYQNGRLLRYYPQKMGYEVKEYMYIHLHKRSMKLIDDVLTSENYTIIPNAFVPLREAVTEKNIQQIRIKYINLHYFRLRWNNLMTKIEMKRNL